MDPWVGKPASVSGTNDQGVTVSYSTSGSDGIFYEPAQWGNGTMPYASTVTADLSGLPAHTMVRVSIVGDYDCNPQNNEELGDVDTLNVSFAGKTGRLVDDNSDPIGMVADGKLNKWVAHTGDSLTVTMTDGDGESNDGDWYFGIKVEVYTPTISASGGGGTMTESGDSNGAGYGSGTATFTVSRDLPTGWQGTPAGDDPVPDTTVSVQRGGTATFGQDYTNAPGSDPLPATTLQLTGSDNSKAYVVRPIDDRVSESRGGHPEDVETVTWNVTTSPGITSLLTAGIKDDSIEYGPYSSVIPEATEVIVDSDSTPQNIVGTDGNGDPIYQRTTYSLMYTKSYQTIGLQNTGEWGTSAHFSGSIGYTSTSTQTVTFGAKVKDFTLSYGRTLGTGTSITATAADSVAAGSNGLKWRTVGYVEHREYFKRSIIERKTGANGDWAASEPGTDVAISNGSGDILGEFKYQRTYWIWSDAELPV